MVTTLYSSLILGEELIEQMVIHIENLVRLYPILWDFPVMVDERDLMDFLRRKNEESPLSVRKQPGLLPSWLVVRNYRVIGRLWLHHTIRRDHEHWWLRLLLYGDLCFCIIRLQWLPSPPQRLRAVVIIPNTPRREIFAFTYDLPTNRLVLMKTFFVSDSNVRVIATFDQLITLQFILGKIYLRFEISGLKLRAKLQLFTMFEYVKRIYPWFPSPVQLEIRWTAGRWEFLVPEAYALLYPDLVAVIPLVLKVWYPHIPCSAHIGSLDGSPSTESSKTHHSVPKSTRQTKEPEKKSLKISKTPQ
jgi:hypothetical protein